MAFTKRDGFHSKAWFLLNKTAPTERNDFH